MYLYYKKFGGLIIFILIGFLLLNTNMSHAQQANNTNTNNNNNKSFYLFPEEIEGLEEEILKIPHDSFSLKTMVAKKDDNVTVNFYNTEAIERHNFVLNQPYNIIQDLAGDQNASFSFIANN